MDKLDSKYGATSFIIYFTEAYMALKKRGLLTDEQFDRVVNLLDKVEDYPSDLFQERLEKIFAGKNFLSTDESL